MSHCKAPSWQRLEWLRKEIAVTNIAVAMAKVHLFCFNAMPGTLQHTIKHRAPNVLSAKAENLNYIGITGIDTENMFMLCVFLTARDLTRCCSLW